MAVIKGNLYVFGARGRVGNIIYRIRNGILELYDMPKKVNRKPSPAQEDQRRLMKRANGFASRLKTDPEMRKFYEKMAKKKHFTNAYHAAISHVMTNPKLLETDFSEYLAQAGDSIRFKPKAWGEVEKVVVSLKDAQGEVIEKGMAEKDAEGWWKYVVQQSHEAAPAVTVEFKIYDDVQTWRAWEKAIPA